MRHTSRALVVASPDAEEGSLAINQDAKIYLSKLDKGASIEQSIAESRHAWLQVLRGSVLLNGTLLATSDGAAVSEERLLKIEASEAAEIMLFDLS